MKVTQMLFAFLFPNYFVLITVVSLLAAILSYGLTFAYFQREFYLIADENYIVDMFISALVAILTFFMVFPFIVTFFMCEKTKYGLKFK